MSLLVWTQKVLLQTPLLLISFSSADCFPWSYWSWLWNLKGLSGKEWNHRYTQPIVPLVCRFWLPAWFVHPNWLQGLSKLRGSGWLHSPGILQSQDPQYTVAGLRIFGCENHSQPLSLCSGSCYMAAESIKVQQMNCPGSATKPGCPVDLGFLSCLSMESGSEWSRPVPQPGMRWHPSGCFLPWECALLILSHRNHDGVLNTVRFWTSLVRLWYGFQCPDPCT